MTETYSKQDDFNGQLDEGQLHEEILAEANITTTLVGVSTSGDVVSIIFQSTISSGERTALNTLVQNHTPQAAYDPRAFIKLNAPDLADAYTNTDVYYVIMSGMLPSFAKAKICNIYVTSKATGSPTSYDVRVYDVTTGETIASINLNNADKEINTMTINNNPSISENIIEVQAKRNGGTDESFVWVYDVTFEYCL